VDLLIIAGVDISHERLIDLVSIAERARPFYDWVESQFSNHSRQLKTLNQSLNEFTLDELQGAITSCYFPSNKANIPKLFDGVGRTYPHTKACFYFFSWIVRDAPQQRLNPLIQKIAKNQGGARSQAEIETLATLIHEYRNIVQNFQWIAVREVLIDRLEGSRRSLKGHEREASVRLGFAVALQSYYERTGGYGQFDDVDILPTQVNLENETYDILITLTDQFNTRRIFVPIKTRETEGGGHPHLFTRDLSVAIEKVTKKYPDSYFAVILIAKSWVMREIELLTAQVDFLLMINQSPNQFTRLNAEDQGKLNQFISDVLDGNLRRKE
jgi:hypothetical protein